MIRAPLSLVVVRLVTMVAHHGRPLSVFIRRFPTNTEEIDRKNINACCLMSTENLSKVEISIRQVKAARALLGWSQGDLAANSSVSEPTIARLEAGDGILGGRPETAAKILAALIEGGIEFILENGGGAGVRLSRSVK